MFEVEGKVRFGAEWFTHTPMAHVEDSEATEPSGRGTASRGKRSEVEGGKWERKGQRGEQR